MFSKLLRLLRNCWFPINQRINCLNTFDIIKKSLEYILIHTIWHLQKNPNIFSSPNNTKYFLTWKHTLILGYINNLVMATIIRSASSIRMIKIEKGSPKCLLLWNNSKKYSLIFLEFKTNKFQEVWLVSWVLVYLML